MGGSQQAAVIKGHRRRLPRRLNVRGRPDGQEPAEQGSLGEVNAREERLDDLELKLRREGRALRQHVESGAREGRARRGGRGPSAAHGAPAGPCQARSSSRATSSIGTQSTRGRPRTI